MHTLKRATIITSLLIGTFAFMEPKGGRNAGHITLTPATSVPSETCQDYADWRTYKANGVNLGGWLVMEKVFYADIWDQHAPGTEDEWTFCQTLGNQCSALLEHHYGTYITTDDIDKIAGIGVEILRIPITYSAFIEVPGSMLNHGNQLTYLRNITEYAITRYDMHIILSLSSLPGGVNALDTGEAIGHDDWFYNTTNLEYSYKVVDAALGFIQSTGHPQHFTFSPIDEASDNIAKLGTTENLTTNGTAWIVDYVRGVIRRVRSTLPCLPIMLQDCFMGEEHWSQYFDIHDNVVMDIHDGGGVFKMKKDGISTVCREGVTRTGAGHLPIFVGKWTLLAPDHNTLARRKNIFDTQSYTWYAYLHGGAFWSIKHDSTTPVNGEGVLKDYLSFEGLIDAGIVKPIGVNSDNINQG